MPTATVRSLSVALSVLAAGAGAIVYSLAKFWGAHPEYCDRFLILAGAAYAAWAVWPLLRVTPACPARIGYVPLLVGAAAFPVGWFLQAQVSPKPLVLWWITGAWVLAAGGFVLVVGGWRHLRLIAFPLAFVFFALPVPDRVLRPLQHLLQSATTTVAAWMLPLLGVAVERNGFVLSLAGGDLGVAEACSGVRSVTALTAIAAFVAWWREFHLVRGVVLVLLSVPVIASVNAVRVIASGLIQEQFGPDYVRGNWHEALGIVMVLLGLGLTIALAGLLKRRSPATADSSPAPPPPVPKAPVFVAVLLVCSAIAAILGQFLGANVEQEVVASAPLEQIPHQLGRWTATDLPVPSDVAEMLTPDVITRRVYSDLGYEVHVWVIFWSSRNMVKGYHHPDVCWPNRGHRLLRRDTIDVRVGSNAIPVTVREFARTTKAGTDTDQQLILYWTQEGGRIWTDEDERLAQTTGAHGWVGERLFSREQARPTGRIVVLLGTRLWGDGATIRSQTLELAGQVATELYRVCPWATPPAPGAEK